MRSNRTRLYLSPILYLFPKTILAELKKIDKYTEGFYIADVDYYKTKNLELAPLLFVVYKDIDEQFNKVLASIRNSSVYYDEYPLDFDSDEMVIVYNLEPWKDKVYKFIEGKYSEMFSTKEQRSAHIHMINNGEISIRYMVFNKLPEAIDYYTKVIEHTYNTSTIPEVINEYDIPPRIQHEVLNYDKDMEFVKQVLKLTNH